jgi:hypothetical protein
MYSGFITPRKTVARLGVHQRLDRAAAKMIRPLIPNGTLPPIKQILKFEGINGPDGLKVKSPDNNPSHVYEAHLHDESMEPITQHYEGLVKALREKDRVRAAFDAAWLAHYVVDGLTPAHHVPLGELKQEAAAMVEEAVAADRSRIAAQVRRQWKLIGAKGLYSMHYNFEMGLAVALLGTQLKGKFVPAHLKKARKIGVTNYFRGEVETIVALDLYHQFYRHGWTSRIVRTCRKKLIPNIIEVLGVIWLLAIEEAGYPLRGDARKAYRAAKAAKKPVKKR